MFGGDTGSAAGKRARHIIPNRIQQYMKSDTKNKRLWNEVKKMDFWSEYEFLHYIFDEAVVCSSYACPKPIKVKYQDSCFLCVS
jgi:hypothetical protein